MSAPPGWITKTESQQIFNRFRRGEFQNHNGAKYAKVIKMSSKATEFQTQLDGVVILAGRTEIDALIRIQPFWK